MTIEFYLPKCRSHVWHQASLVKQSSRNNVSKLERYIQEEAMREIQGTSCVLTGTKRV